MWAQITNYDLTKDLRCRACGAKTIYADHKDWLWCGDCEAFNGVFVVNAVPEQLMLPLINPDGVLYDLVRRHSQTETSTT